MSNEKEARFTVLLYRATAGHTIVDCVLIHPLECDAT